MTSTLQIQFKNGETKFVFDLPDDAEVYDYDGSIYRAGDTFFFDAKEAYWWHLTPDETEDEDTPEIISEETAQYLAEIASLNAKVRSLQAQLEIERGLNGQRTPPLPFGQRGTGAVWPPYTVTNQDTPPAT